MAKPRRSRSPRAEVLARLRQLEALCASQAETTEHTYYGVLGHLLDVLGVAVVGTRDPAVLLTVVAMHASRRVESMLVHRMQAWRGMATGGPRD